MSEIGEGTARQRGLISTIGRASEAIDANRISISDQEIALEARVRLEDRLTGDAEDRRVCARCRLKRRRLRSRPGGRGTNERSDGVEPSRVSRMVNEWNQPKWVCVEGSGRRDRDAEQGSISRRPRRRTDASADSGRNGQVQSHLELPASRRRVQDPAGQCWSGRPTRESHSIALSLGRS